VQIEDDVQGFSYHTDLTSIAVYGGVPMDQQERALKSGVDIVVATPGRLMDHMRNGAVAFDKLDTLVLDEADRMMDMGFWPDVRRIVSALPDAAARQTLLFSATMPAEVMTLADEVVRDAKYVQIGTDGGPAKSITHTIENVAASQKTEWLAKFLRRTDGPVLVFVRTKSGAERLARKLAALGLKAAALHADRTQAQRSQAVEGFRSGRYRVLVATDVAARGLDIDGITHVVNYEVPSNRETYVHRVGRTGRADATGTALTLVAPEELRALQALQRSFGIEMQG
jgi:ATP-dependent RNA helicase RhlE